MIYVYWKVGDKLHKNVRIWWFNQVSNVRYSLLGHDRISPSKYEIQVLCFASPSLIKRCKVWWVSLYYENNLYSCTNPTKVLGNHKVASFKWGREVFSSWLMLQYKQLCHLELMIQYLRMSVIEHGYIKPVARPGGGKYLRSLRFRINPFLSLWEAALGFLLVPFRVWMHMKLQLHIMNLLWPMNPPVSHVQKYFVISSSEISKLDLS